MASAGYLGGDIIRQDMPARAGDPMAAGIRRPAGLDSHVAAIRRREVVMDAAVIVARWHGFLTPATRVEVAAAQSQAVGDGDGECAAHAVKRFTFDQRDIVDVYTRKGIPEVAPDGLRTMLGLATALDRRANLPLDQRLQTAPQRRAQFQRVVASSVTSLAAAYELARDLELQRRNFERALLAGLRGRFGGEAQYDALLAAYDAGLAVPPPPAEAPERMIDMVADLVD